MINPFMGKEFFIPALLLSSARRFSLFKAILPRQKKVNRSEIFLFMFFRLDWGGAGETQFHVRTKQRKIL
jgi:hypothetical protein